MNRKIPPDAFEYYVSLGSDRTHTAVAEKYGVSLRAIAKCATRENWSGRLETIERESRERTDQRIGETLDDIRARHLRTLRAMNARALEALKNYPITSGMDAMRAAEMVIKLERLIAGEPSERTELTVEEVTKREMSRWLTDEPENEPALEGAGVDGREQRS